MNEPVAIGEILLGKYRVERILGQGGMGLVVAVRHVDLGQLWAMKFLLPAAIGHEESLERFLREAKAAARLKSDHVAKVQDVGRMANGAPYMLMEYLEGCDLKALVSQEGPLPIEDAVTYMLQVCEAIAEAHAAGIVHRDLKPANLFLVRRRDGSPCVKVLDFGISKQLDHAGVDLTNTNAALGSPLYMSPEQMNQSKTVDLRTDIWALGVILYELMAGTSPFRGASIYEVTSRVLQEEPTPLHELRRDVPADLEAVIAKCMRKRREERFQSVEALQEALARFAPAGMPFRAPMPSLTNQPVVVMSALTGGEATTITFGGTGKPLLPKKPRPMLWAVLGAGLVLVIGVPISYRWTRHEPAAEVASSVSEGPAMAPVLSAAVSLVLQSEIPPSALDVTQNHEAAPAPSVSVLERPKPAVVKVAPAPAPRPKLTVPAPAPKPTVTVPALAPAPAPEPTRRTTPF